SRRKARPEQVGRETEHAPEPPCPSWRGAGHAIPVELRPGVLHQDGDVAEPERPPAAVAEEVQDDEPQVAFRAEDAHRVAVEVLYTRPFPHVSPRAVGQLRTAVVEVDRQTGRPRCGRGARVLVTADVEVHVAAGPKPGPGIAPRDRPAL